MSILRWLEDKDFYNTLLNNPKIPGRRVRLINTQRRIEAEGPCFIAEWTTCDTCGRSVYLETHSRKNFICESCNCYLRLTSERRLFSLLDKDTYRPMDELVSSCDPLEFTDTKPYIKRLKDSQYKTRFPDAVQTGTGRIKKIPVAIGVMSFPFMGGSMGSVVGERITRLIEYATEKGLSLVLVSASGGARMQEGPFSLMQMAKISAALKFHQDYAHLFFISIITTPTTGGVTASFAMLGDAIIAEPEATIAFAGRRVIVQTLAEDLPPNFQTAEYLFERGFIDLIVPRKFLRNVIFKFLIFNKKAKYKQTGVVPNFEKVFPSQDVPGTFPRTQVVDDGTLEAEYESVLDVIRELELKTEIAELHEIMDIYEAKLERDERATAAFKVRKEKLRQAELDVAAAEKTILSLKTEIEQYIKEFSEEPVVTNKTVFTEFDTMETDTTKVEKGKSNQSTTNYAGDPPEPIWDPPPDYDD